MHPGALRDAQPSVIRAVLPEYLAGFIADAQAAARSRERTAEVLAAHGDEELSELALAIATLGDEDRVYRALPIARAISRAWCRDVLDITLTGGEHLVAAAARGPTVVVSNHLSFVDTTATDAALAWAGHAALADRMIAVAGPKVYTDTFRRFAAACLSTLPAPQSTQIEGAGALGLRALGIRALESVRLARAAVESGDILLVYPEGSRSRTGRLRPFLGAVYRYLASTGLAIVPAAVTGTNDVLPIGETRLQRKSVRIALGEPLEVSDDRGGEKVALEAAHAALAALLPESHRPA